jgi:hypothetical protein
MLSIFWSFSVAYSKFLHILFELKLQLACMHASKQVMKPSFDLQFANTFSPTPMLCFLYDLDVYKYLQVL